MPNVRKPKPRPEPSTLRELVRDIDERLEGGDALSDVWLPHEDWTRLVEQADEEMLTAAAENGAKKRAAANSPEKPDGSEQLEQLRRGIAKALDCDFDIEPEALLEVARAAGELQRAFAGSYQPLNFRPAAMRMLGLDPEGQDEEFFALLRAAAKTLQAKPAAENGDPDCPSCGAGEEQEPEHPECPTCGEADGHKPADCAMREEAEEKPKKRSRKAKPKQAALLDQPAPGEADRKLRPHRMRIDDEQVEDGAPF